MIGYLIGALSGLSSEAQVFPYATVHAWFVKFTMTTDIARIEKTEIV